MEKLYFPTTRGLKLCGILEIANSKSKEITILIPGYSSSKDRPTSATIAAGLANLEKNSFRIDLGGCGESEGKFGEQTVSTMVEDVISAIDFMKAKGFETINLAGSSGGALAAMEASLLRKINKLALIAPVSDYYAQRLRRYGQKYFDEWKRNGYNFYKLANGAQTKVNYNFAEDAKKHIIYERASKIACPTLIIHGDADKEVSINDTKKLVKLIPNVKLCIIKGGNHQVSVNGDRTRALKIIVNWLVG